MKRIFSNWMVNDNSSYAAAIAFYTIFSFPPLFIFTFNLASYCLGKETVKQEIINEFANSINYETAYLIESIFSYSDMSKLSSSILSLLLLWYSSTKVFAILHDSFTRIFKIANPPNKTKLRTYLEGQLVAFILVPAVCLFYIVSLFINIVVERSTFFKSFLGTQIPWLINLSNYLISFMVLLSVSFLLIKFLSKQRASLKAALAGAFISALLFEFGHLLLSIYLSHTLVKNFYGPMESLVILMLWAYFSAQFLLIGAEVAQYIRERNSVDYL